MQTTNTINWNKKTFLTNMFAYVYQENVTAKKWVAFGSTYSASCTEKNDSVPVDIAYFCICGFFCR